MESFGALNTKGFSSQIQYGNLPEPSHLTYEGIFNEIKFDVGQVPQLPLDLQLGYARYQFLSSTYDKNINDYLALFVKGNKDGKDRGQRPLNATICLDVSGSMGGGLTNGEKDWRSRLNLSIEAIKMFFSKLRPTDSFGLITFHNNAKVIIEQTQVSQINLDDAFKQLDKIKAGGGTTIKYGFEASQNMLYEYVLTHQCVNSENRIIMLTDVQDNSIASQRQFLQKASAETGTTLTIIGISNQFKSQVCQELKNVKGFNYFCAVDQEDIKKYVFEEFDFVYFPSAFNLQIYLQSSDVNSFEVYGSTDAKEVKAYNKNFYTQETQYIISKMKSSFPSAIQIIDGRVHNYGGLILVKLNRKSKEPFFNGKITLQYEEASGQKHLQTYLLNYQFHPEEQFFTDETLRTALEAFTFVSELKELLNENQSTQIMQRRQLYEKYWPVLPDIQKFAPESKQKDLENLKTILKEYGKQLQHAKKEENFKNMMF